MLSGDKIKNLGPEQIASLLKLIPPTGKGARFDDAIFETGITAMDGKEFLYAFNWSETKVNRTLHFSGKAHLKDFWTDEDLRVHQGSFAVKDLPGSSARLIVAVH